MCRDINPANGNKKCPNNRASNSQLQLFAWPVAVAAPRSRSQVNSVAALSDEYHRLFEGAMVCPLNETAYVRRDKGAIIGDMCGFYRAFGWPPRTGTGEKPDHLVHELQFEGVLLTMLAQAQHLGDSERMEIVGDALRKFGGDHLGDWLPIVVDNILEQTRSELFRSLAGILRRAWDATVKEHSIPVTIPEELLPPPSIPTLGPDDDALVDSPYEACGFETAPGLVQIRQSNRE